MYDTQQPAYLHVCHESGNTIQALSMPLHAHTQTCTKYNYLRNSGLVVRHGIACVCTSISPTYGSLLAQESLKPLFPPFSKNSVHLEPHPPPADMTSDYVDAVLFQLHWEAFEDLDARARRLLYQGTPCGCRKISMQMSGAHRSLKWKVGRVHV